MLFNAVMYAKRRACTNFQLVGIRRSTGEESRFAGFTCRSTCEIQKVGTNFLSVVAGKTGLSNPRWDTLRLHNGLSQKSRKQFRLYVFEAHVVQRAAAAAAACWPTARSIITRYIIYAAVFDVHALYVCTCARMYTDAEVRSYEPWQRGQYSWRLASATNPTNRPPLSTLRAPCPRAGPYQISSAPMLLAPREYLRPKISATTGWKSHQFRVGRDYSWLHCLCESLDLMGSPKWDLFSLQWTVDWSCRIVRDQFYLFFISVITCWNLSSFLTGWLLEADSSFSLGENFDF